MGLAVQVGVLAEHLRTGDEEGVRRMQADFERINAVLLERGLPEHSEPESFDGQELVSRASLTSFPYSWLHRLRRFAAHVMRDPKWVPYPVQPGEDPARDLVLYEMYQNMSSHLLCHSDSEGYYLPVEFEELILDPEHEISGGVVGSSVRLREELLELSGPLEIEVDEAGNLDDEVAGSVSKQRPNQVPFAIERLVWLALYEAARLSIEYDTAVVFR